MFKSVVWSDETYTLNSFVDNFVLPQLVQVESGIYSEDDAKTLSAGQTLTLHVTKRTDVVLAKAAGRREFFIPVNCPYKVEILPTICDDTYYSVQDVVEAISVKYIRVVHDSPPSLRLKAGDILELKRTVEENRGKFIECEFVNKVRDTVKLPLEFKAAFEPLARTEQCHLQDLLSLYKLPVRVKFTSSGKTKIQDANKEVDVMSLGSVLLNAVHQQSTIIGTSRADNVVTVLMIPKDLDVTVKPAQGALTGDETYTRICREIHDGVDLEKVNLSLVNASTLCGKSDIEVLYDYVEVRPLVPTRNPDGWWRDNEDCDSSEEYIEIPPPRPPKSPKQVPAQQLFPRDKEFQKQRFGSDDAPNLESDEAPPPPPVRTVSRQYVLTENRGANNDYYNVQSSSTVDDSASNHPSETEHKFQAGNNETGDSDGDFNNDDNDDDDDDNSFDEDSDNSDHDYLYPEVPVTNFPDNGDQDYLYPVLPDANLQSTSNPPQKKLTKTSNKSPLRDRLTDLFKKAPIKNSNTTETGPPSALGVAFGVGGSSFVKQPSKVSNVASLSLSTSPPVPSASNLQHDFPDDLRCLSVSEVGECLEKLNLGKHVETFDSNQIDGELFVTLNEGLLTSLDVSNKFEQNKIMMFINGWRPRRK